MKNRLKKVIACAFAAMMVMGVSSTALAADVNPSVEVTPASVMSKRWGSSMPQLSTKHVSQTLGATEIVQRFMNAWNDSGLTTDRKYGSNTAKAVKKFQKDQGLTQDGICGEDTWSKMDNFKYSATTTNGYTFYCTKDINGKKTYLGGVAKYNNSQGKWYSQTGVLVKDPS